MEPKWYIKVPQIKFEMDKNSIYQMMIAMLEVKTIKTPVQLSDNSSSNLIYPVGFALNQRILSQTLQPLSIVLKIT